MTIAFRPTAEQEARLDALARRTGRSKSFYLKEALDRYLDELEDIYWSHTVVADWESEGWPTRPLQALKDELGL
jgi:RHH-type rel operon transcriptional repressor/antitoxin RelB